MDDALTDRRERRIRIASWVSFGAIALGLSAGWLFSLGQDAAGAGMARSIGILGAAVVAFPASVVGVWSGGRAWNELDGRHRTLVFLLMVLVLAPILSFGIAVGIELSQPVEPATFDMPL